MCLPEPGEQFKAGLICTTVGWGRLTESKNFYASTLNQMSELSGGQSKNRIFNLLFFKKTIVQTCFKRGNIKMYLEVQVFSKDTKLNGAGIFDSERVEE